MIGEVLRENAKAVKDYRGGNEKAMHFLFGKVMQKTKNTADPEAVKKKLGDLLG